MVHETFLYNGNEFSMDTDPLFQYYRLSRSVNSRKKDIDQLDDIPTIKNKNDKDFLEQQRRFCSLGYNVRSIDQIFHYGTWEIKDNKLYLVDFYGYNAKREKVGMDYLYPNQKEVFAKWFTGEICVLMGEYHSFNTRHAVMTRVIPDEYVHFNFIKGVFVGKRVIDNIKIIADEYSHEVFEQSRLSYGPDFAMYPNDYHELYKKAINFYEKLLESFPLYAKAYLYMGETNYAKKDFEQAILNYQKAIEIEPSLSEAYVKLAFVHSVEDNEKYFNLDISINFYQKALEVDPTRFELYSRLGNLFISKGKFDEAICNFQNAIKYNSENTFNGEISYSRRRITEIYNEKINDLMKAVFIDPSSDILRSRNVEAYNELGNIYSEQIDVDNEIYCFQKSIEILQTSKMTDDELRELLLNAYLRFICIYDYYNNKKVIFLSIEDYEKTIFYCEEALKLFPENEDVFYRKLIDVYAKVGEVCSYKEKKTQAFESYQKAAVLGLEYSNKSIDLGNVYFKNNDFLNAIRHYSEAIDIDIIYIDRLFTLGYWLYEDENYKDAISPLKLASKICERHIDVFNKFSINKDAYDDSQIKTDLNKFLAHKDSLLSDVIESSYLLKSISVAQGIGIHDWAW